MLVGLLSDLLIVTRSLVGVEQMLSLGEIRRFGWPPYQQYHYSRLQRSCQRPPAVSCVTVCSV